MVIPNKTAGLEGTFGDYLEHPEEYSNLSDLTAKQRYTNKRDVGINHNKVADAIHAEHRLIYCTGVFYEYIDGCYRPIAEEIIRQWIKELIGDRFKTNIANEIIFTLKTDAYLEPNRLNYTVYLNLKNGLFNLQNEELISHTPDIYSSIQLNVDYVKSAPYEKWLDTIYQIFDKDEAKVATLKEFFGLCLTKDTKYEKALFMLGDGANGKSTVLYILEHLLCRENIIAIPLEKLSSSHYQAAFFGKLANISVETSAKSEVYDSVFKQLVTGDPITADRKYGQEFTFNPYCKLIYALNNMPRVNDKTQAFYRRLLILKFERQFGDDIANKNLKYELLEELDGIFLWCLDGLRSLRARGYFAIDPKMQAEIDEYRRENNNVLLFVEEVCELGSDFEISKQALYMEFGNWCDKSGHKALSMKRFSMELLKQYRSIEDARDNLGNRTWRGIQLQGLVGRGN